MHSVNPAIVTREEIMASAQSDHLLEVFGAVVFALLFAQFLFRTRRHLTATS